MSLRTDQSKFVQMIADFIEFVTLEGYELSFGDAYRDPRVFGKEGEKKGYGHKSSYHKRRLAVDFNLFVDGEYMSGGCPEYTEIGKYWESIGGTWGGRFNDHNHFSYGESR